MCIWILDDRYLTKLEKRSLICSTCFIILLVLFNMFLNQISQKTKQRFQPTISKFQTGYFMGGCHFGQKQLNFTTVCSPLMNPTPYLIVLRFGNLISIILTDVDLKSWVSSSLFLMEKRPISILWGVEWKKRSNCSIELCQSSFNNWELSTIHYWGGAMTSPTCLRKKYSMTSHHEGEWHPPSKDN